MGYFSHILLAVGAVLAADAGIATGWDLPWALLALVPLPHLFGAWIRRRSLLGKFREVAIGTRLLALSPAILQALAVGVFGWNERVVDWLGREAEELGLLLALAPFVVYEFLAIDARARLFAVIPREVARLRGFQVRMFLSGLLPIVVYMVLAGVLTLDEALRAHVEEVALYQALFTLGSLSVFAFALPAILRNTWETVPMPAGSARELLRSIADRAGFVCDRLLVWKTGHQVSNAAVVGFHPRHRTVLFSDLLLAQLEPRELAAVFAHEIGHTRRRHVAVFAAWTLAFFLVAELSLGLFDPGSEAWVAAAAAWVLLWYLVFGFLSRRFELDADLESLAITGDPTALVAALERVEGVHSHGRDTWRHFSTAKRVNFIRAQAVDPEVGRRLRRSLARWSRVGVALLVVGAIAQLVSMTGAWNADHIDAELRLGRYRNAAERVDASTDERLAELARFAASASDARGTISRATLEASVVDALRASEPAVALVWLELGARRGWEAHSDAFGRLRDALRAAEDEDAAERAMAGLADEFTAAPTD